MYTVVLMAALSTSPAVPDWGQHGCTGCYGSYSGYGYGGCQDWWGRGFYSYPAFVSGCTGFDGPFGYFNYYGGYGFGPYYPAYVSYHEIPNPTRPAEPIPGPTNGKEQASTASFSVDLPAGAKLFVDGQPTEANATVLTYKSPALAWGQLYVYTFRAEVVRGGQTKSESQHVHFRPGESLRVAFPELAGTGTVTAQASKR